MGFQPILEIQGLSVLSGAEGTVQPATKYVRLARLLDLRRPDQSPQPTTAGTLRLILDCTTRNYRASVIRTCDIPSRPPVPSQLVVSLCPSVNRAVRTCATREQDPQYRL